MLITGFFLLLLLLLALIFTGLQKAGLPETLRKKYIRNTAIGLGLWLGYATLISGSGLLQTLTLPPRVVVFLILPVFAFTAWFFLSKKSEPLVQAVPPAWPVYFQTFRVWVEILILGMYLEGLASVEPTLEGYNFDMLAGLSAPVVAWLVFERQVLPKRALLVWNIFGLLLLVNVVTIYNTLLLRPELWGYETSPVPPDFGGMPYLLIACFFMPCAVFMHVFSLVQLRRGV